MKAYYKDKIDVNVTSEIGKLNGVIIHTPGPEVENMTPKNAERALYSDILNLAEASKEYNQFRSILDRHTQTFEIQKLLHDILYNDFLKECLVDKICKNENVIDLKEHLLRLDPKELSIQLLGGVPLRRNNLTNFLSNERFALKPLHNFFFTRDASITVNEKVLIGRMASRVREREAIIMEAIFNNHPVMKVETSNPVNDIDFNKDITIEGGDVLVAREDVLLIGNSPRTSTQGIDYIIEKWKNGMEKKKHIIVQELPSTPESFIHLDMTFTFLDKNQVMVYEPVILNPNRFKTVHITIDNGKVEIKEEKNILEVLEKLNFELEPVFCGGKADIWTQEREQWHSGANFFALGPGKIIGYGRNVHTLDEMNKHGYEIIKASDVISKKIDFKDYEKYVVTIRSSELSRGGGGCRCMTMPVSREKVDW